MDTASHDFKTAAHQIIESLPSGATWDDLMYHVYVRQCIDAGLNDAENDRVTDVGDIREKFGLKR